MARSWLTLIIGLATGMASVMSAQLGAPPVAAHLGAGAYIFVDAEFVLQGAPFGVVVSDVSPSATVSFELNADDYSASIGSVTAGADGHFQTTLTMPADAPGGYVELAAASPDGTRVATWLMVGPPSASTGAPPSTSGFGAGIDLSVIVLTVLLGGAAGGVGYLLLRRKGVPAPVSARATGGRVPKRRKSAGRPEKR